MPSTQTLFPVEAGELPSNWTGGNYKLILLKATVTPDPTAQTYVADVVAHELTGTGYSAASRPALTGKAIAKDAPNNKLLYNADKLTIPEINVGDVPAFGIYREVNNDSDSPLLVIFKQDALATTGRDLEIVFPSNTVVSTSYPDAIAPQELDATDWQTGTYGVVILDTNFAHDPATHNFVADLAANEITGTGWDPLNRPTLANTIVEDDTANEKLLFKADDLTIANLNIGDANEPAGAIVVYRSATDDTDSPVVGIIDPPDVAPNGGNYHITFTDGVLFAVGYAETSTV